MAEPWLQARSLRRVYRRGPSEVRAVDGVDLDVARGEFLAIVGASGSGKSTLLNLLAGLDSPTGGSIRVAGQELTALDRRARASYRARRVGMVFQTFNLLVHHTALENVELALAFNGAPRRDRRARARAILARLGLVDRLDHWPGGLSGGEQQRVAIARALVKEPEVLFADEPTGNLDEDNSLQIAALLGEFNARGLTVLMVTHDLALARGSARRLVRMHYGRLAEAPAWEAP
ncbi:MAG: ABC transporter ATP-binding protein [Candidatus Krumholzibacteriota bacterium]|nr:ABC transporter ATP-binding protein [Candidatus Krumholzibacteriota bacterium]